MKHKAVVAALTMIISTAHAEVISIEPPMATPSTLAPSTITAQPTTTVIVQQAINTPIPATVHASSPMPLVVSATQASSQPPQVTQIVPKGFEFRAESGGRLSDSIISAYQQLGWKIVTWATKRDEVFEDASYVKVFNPGQEKEMSEWLGGALRNYGLMVGQAWPETGVLTIVDYQAR